MKNIRSRGQKIKNKVQYSYSGAQSKALEKSRVFNPALKDRTVEALLSS